MEAQLHRTHEHDHHEDPLHSTDVHGEEKRGGETKSTIKKVKEKVGKLKAAIKHGGSELKDEAETVNNSSVVRSGLMEPTVMGTPVLAEDLYATRSDIVDPLVRSFAQWQEEEKRGSPPPLSTNYETRHTDQPHGGHRDENREELKGSIGKHTHVQEEKDDAPPPPLSAAVETRHTDLPHGDHHTYGGDVNRDQLKGNIENPDDWKDEERRGMPPPPPSGGYESFENPTGMEEEGRYGAGYQNPQQPPSGGYESFENPTGMEEEGRYGAAPPPPTGYNQNPQQPPSTGYESFENPTGIEEEGRYRAPPPPSSGYQGQQLDPSYVVYETYDQMVNREQLRGSVGNPISMEEEGGYGAPTNQPTGQSQVRYDAYVEEDMNSYPVPAGISVEVVEEETTDTGGRITDANYIRRN